jgi:hypothetical protein
MPAQVVRIDGEEFIAQLIVAGVAGMDVEARADQAARSLRGDRTRGGKRQCRQSARGAHAIQRERQVGRRVGERAVEVKEDRLDHALVACMM